LTKKITLLLVCVEVVVISELIMVNFVVLVVGTAVDAAIAKKNKSNNIHLFCIYWKEGKTK